MSFKICHISPFAPHRCGLYEASRDMARADIESGNTVFFVDAGITENGVRSQSKPGQIDDRAGFKLQTCSHELIPECDIIIQHTGCPDIWTVKSQAPLLWVIHGRPLACFRPEQQGKGNSFSLYTDLSKWPRSKGMIYFWPEFQKYWETAIDKEKHIVLDYPVIDHNHFNNKLEKYNFINQGKINILICDSSREDIDLFEMICGIIEYARNSSDNVKFHFYGMDYPIRNCTNVLLLKLKELGFLGDVAGRVKNISNIISSADLLISPNRIVTRTIGESISCGTPILAEHTCKVADYTAYFPDIGDLSNKINNAVVDIKNKKISKEKILKRAELFSMHNYSKKMNEVYKNITK